MRDTEIGFSEKFRDNSNSLDQVKKIISKSEERCKEVQEMSSEPNIEVNWTQKEFYLKETNGVHGRTHSTNKIEIILNTDTKNWKETLKTQFAHEYGHTYFFELTGFKYESNIENWRHFFLEAHGQHFSKEAYPESKPKWRTEVSRHEIMRKWLEIKPKMNKKIFSTKIIGSREYPLFFGYSAAYYIGEKLLEDYKLSEFPKLEKEDVVRVGDKIFT